MIFFIPHSFKFILLLPTFLSFPYFLFSSSFLSTLFPNTYTEYICIYERPRFYTVGNMKDFGSFSVLAMVIGIGFVCLVYSTKDGSFSNPVFWNSPSSYPQDNGHAPSLDEGDMGKVNLEDYRPIDPVPSSKASIRPGPIQHGTPLMPYIPAPPAPPPSRPRRVGFP